MKQELKTGVNLALVFGNGVPVNSAHGSFLGGNNEGSSNSLLVVLSLLVFALFRPRFSLFW